MLPFSRAISSSSTSSWFSGFRGLQRISFTRSRLKFWEEAACITRAVSGSPHRTPYRDYLFADFHQAAIRRHEDYLETYLHPLAKTAKQVCHEERRGGIVQVSRAKEHGGEMDFMSRVPEGLHQLGRKGVPPNREAEGSLVCGTRTDGVSRQASPRNP